MELLLEEDANVMKSGGSVYVLIPPAYYKYVGIEVENNDDINSDLKISMALAKHGKFIYLHSPKQQRKYKREKEK